MFSVNDTLSSFINWLNQTMHEKNITQADIARTGYVTRGAVSQLLTYRIKSVGMDMCKAIATATGIPLAVVFEKAAILPAQPGADETLERIEYIYNTLQDPGNKQRTLDYIELLKTQEEKAKGNATKNTATQPR